VKTIPIRHCNFEAKVKTAGSGPPLVYLHAAGGPIWDPFVEWLCERHTVYAPHHPGTGDTARDAIYAVDSLWDLVLIYDEIFDALDLPIGAGDRHVVRRHDGVRVRRASAGARQQDGRPRSHRIVAR
jgi:pimeloyl-ACP methyl ester carboxylesterase